MIGMRMKPSPRQITVTMPYPGKIISVNHYKGRRRDGGEFVRREARDWMEQLEWLIKLEHIDEWPLPLHVTCSGHFRDRRHAPDLSNLSKCTLDAIEEVTGLNDQDFRWHDGERIIDADKEPELVITIEEEEVRQVKRLGKQCPGCDHDLIQMPFNKDFNVVVCDNSTCKQYRRPVSSVRILEPLPLLLSQAPRPVVKSKKKLGVKK